MLYGKAMRFSSSRLAVILLSCSTVAWTYSNATHPAGAVDVGGGASGGGILQQDGHYYIMTVGHMAQPLGVFKQEYQPGTGTLGKVAYTTYDGRVIQPDIALIDTGTDYVAPVLRVSHGWLDAPIVHYAKGNGDLPAGMNVCHSGWSQATQNAGGFRCGTLANECTSSKNLCQIDASGPLVDGGDSGGPVWWYDGQGVKLIGFMDLSGNGGKSGYFVPVWTYLRQAWTAAQTYAPDGYPTGKRSGCLLTINGCDG